MIPKYNFNKNKLFFTADLHFYHNNIIQYDNRPFDSLEEMHEQLILNWNRKIPPDSDVIVAGDFAFTGAVEKLHSLIQKLNGRIWLVMGNHDYQNKYNRNSVEMLFFETADMLDFKVEDNEIEDGYLKFHINHYPCEFWTRGAIHLHGHIHSGGTKANEKTTFKPMRYDIGVTNNNYTPVSYNEIKVIITKQLNK